MDHLENLLDDMIIVYRQSSGDQRINLKKLILRLDTIIHIMAEELNENEELNTKGV